MILSLLTLPFRLLVFLLWFGWELWKSSFAVLADILSPGHGATPRIVRMPLGDASDLHVTSIGILITLTPGTLTMGAVDDPGGTRSLLVHSLYHPDAPSALEDLADMDRRLVAAVRVGGRP